VHQTNNEKTENPMHAMERGEPYSLLMKVSMLLPCASGLPKIDHAQTGQSVCVTIAPRPEHNRRSSRTGIESQNVIRIWYFSGSFHANS